MPEATARATELRTLRTSDPNLPLVAAQAAIEFDKALQGLSVDFRAAKLLVAFLRTSLKKPVDTPDEVRNLDISTVGIVARALDKSPWGPNPTTVSDVVDRAWQIASSMTDASSAPSKAQSDLEQLRDFCVALGNSLIAYRESLRENIPIHPDRK